MNIRTESDTANWASFDAKEVPNNIKIEKVYTSPDSAMTLATRDKWWFEYDMPRRLRAN